MFIQNQINKKWLKCEENYQHGIFKVRNIYSLVSFYCQPQNNSL